MESGLESHGPCSSACEVSTVGIGLETTELERNFSPPPGDDGRRKRELDPRLRRRVRQHERGRPRSTLLGRALTETRRDEETSLRGETRQRRAD